MEMMDKRFSELFIAPPCGERTMSLKSHHSVVKVEEALQRRPSLKKRILGVFQSNKRSRESSPEPNRSLKRKSAQKIERPLPFTSTGSALSKENECSERLIGGSTTPTSSCFTAPKLFPPVSMSQYPALQMKQQEQHSQQPLLIPRSVPQSSITTTITPTRTGPLFQQNALPPIFRDQSPVSRRRFSIQPQSQSRNTSPASTSRFSFRRRSTQLDNISDTLSSVTVHPAPSLTSHLISSLLSKDHKHCKSNSSSTTGHDSKYSSSMSSLHSVHSAESTPRTSASSSPVAAIPKPVSNIDFAELERIARRLERRLDQQFEQCQQLSINLVRLTGKKIQSLKKSDAMIRAAGLPARLENTGMKAAINCAKSNVRVLFLKKSAILQRTSFELATVKETLQQARKKRDEIHGNFVVDLDCFYRMERIIQEDLARQRDLDKEMRAVLETMMVDENFQFHWRDRTEMVNFRLFVDGRLAMMENNYRCIGLLCGRILKMDI